MRSFSKLHPIVGLVYYMGAVILTCAFLNPIIAGISFLGAVITCADGRGRALGISLPLILITACINPIVNTRGETVLFHLTASHPITLQAIVYGCVFALMLGAVVVHFISFNRDFTSDKIIFLFSPIAPALSLIFALTLKLIPNFAKNLSENLALRKTLHGKSDLSVALKAISATVSHTLESSMITAESMKARAFGEGKRTSFAIYRFTRRDAVYLLVILALVVYVITGGALGCLSFSAFPSLVIKPVDFYGASVYLAFFILISLKGGARCHK